MIAASFALVRFCVSASQRLAAAAHG